MPQNSLSPSSFMKKRYGQPDSPSSFMAPVMEEAPVRKTVPPGKPREEGFGTKYIGKPIVTALGRAINPASQMAYDIGALRSEAPMADIQRSSDEVAFSRGRGALRTFLPSTKLADYWRGPMQALAHPIDSAELLFGAVADAQRAEADRAVQEYDRGGVRGVVKAGGHALASGVPLFGPMFADSAEKLSSPESDVRTRAEGEGGIAGGFAGLYSGKKIGDVQSGVARGIAQRITKVAAPYADRMRVRAPGEEFTGKEIIQTAKQRGIRLAPGQVPGASKGVRLLQGAAEKSITGAGRMQRSNEANLTKLGQSFEKKLSGYSQIADPEQRGVIAQEKLEGALKTTKGELGQRFDKVVGQGVGAKAVDPNPVLRLSRSMRRETAAADKALPSLARTGVTNLLNDIEKAFAPNKKTGTQQQASVKTALELRSRLLEEGRMASDEHVAAAARRLAGALDSSLERTLKRADPKTYKAWRAVNRDYRDFREVYWNKRSPFTRAINEVDAGKAMGRIVGKRGGSPFMAKKLVAILQNDPEALGLFKREALEALLDPNRTGEFDTKNFASRLSRVNDPYLKALFQGNDLRDIKKLARIAKALHYEINPSGTAQTLGSRAELAGLGGAAALTLMQAMRGDLKGAGITAGVTAGAEAAPYGIARFLTSDVGSKWLTEGYGRRGLFAQRAKAAQNAPVPTASPKSGQKPQGGQGLMTRRFVRVPKGRPGARPRLGSQAGIATPAMLTGGVLDALFRKMAGRGGAPDLDLQGVVREYLRENKLPENFPPDEQFVDVDPRAAAIADAYDAMAHDPANPEVAKSYGALIEGVNRQWDYATKKLGIEFEPWKGEGQPYKDSAEMMTDVRRNKHLYFYQGGVTQALKTGGASAIGNKKTPTETFHVTSARNVDSILKNGLKGGEEGVVWHAGDRAEAAAHVNLPANENEIAVVRLKPGVEKVRVESRSGAYASKAIPPEMIDSIEVYDRNEFSRSGGKRGEKRMIEPYARDAKEEIKASDKPRTKFGKALRSETTPNPFYGRERVLGDSAAIEISEQWGGDNDILVNSIRSFEKGKGSGSKALTLLTTLADKYGVNLHLDAKPFGDQGGLKKADLIKFYKRHGFVQNQNYATKESLIYRPKRP
jgi:hypothetical protein